MTSPPPNGAAAAPGSGVAAGPGAAPSAPVATRDSGPHAGYPRVTQASRQLVNRFCERLEAVHARHLDVEHDHVRHVAFDDGEAFRS